MAYIVIEDFRAGLDRRKSILTAPPGTLWTGNDCHITRGGEIEKRKAFVSKYTLPAGTVGLFGVGQLLYAFGDAAAPTGMPPNVQYQRLQPPSGSPTLLRILSAEIYDGKPYVIGEFSDGNIYHYFNGTRVSTWDTVSASVASGFNVALALASKVDKDAAVSAIAVGAVVTITAAVAGTDFTISASAVDGGSDNTQSLTLSTIQANVVAAAEAQATGSVTITGGTQGAGNEVSAITVNGVDILGAPVAWWNSNADTAAAVVAQINSFTSSPEYTASAAGAVVTITALAGTGAGPNGFVVARTVGGTVTATTTNMAGGSAAVSAVAKVVTATVGGVFEPADIYTITINGTAYVVSGRASGTGTFVATLKDKVYATVASLAYFCATGTPATWGSGTGAGFINMSSQAAGSELLTGLAVYQNNLAVFARRAIQIWYVDADPALNRQLQVLNNFGTFAPNTISEVGDSDIFFLSPSGVRSLRTRDSINIGSVYDIGTPIDELVQVDVAALSEEARSRTMAIIEPSDGRYWLVLGNKIYVFSFFAQSKISAWSTYTPGFTVDAVATINDQVYVRSGNTIYLYGGDSGNVYDSTQAIAELPYLDAKTPATTKTFEGVDVSLEGRWDISVGFNPETPSVRDLIGAFDRSSFGLGRITGVGQGTHFGARFVSQGSGYAKLANMIIHYSGGEAT